MTRWTEGQLMAFVSRGRRAQKAVDEAIFKITEKQWQEQVEALLMFCGWRFYHTRDSRKSNEGFPDIITLRRRRMVVAELKVGDEQPSPKQEEWLEDFKGVPGAEVYVWRPEDIEEVKRALR